MLTLIPHHEFLPGHRVQPGTQVFKMRELTRTSQTETFRPDSLPSHLNLTVLSQVVTHSHVLAEILHGTMSKDTGLIESDHAYDPV